MLRFFGGRDKRSTGRPTIPGNLVRWTWLAAAGGSGFLIQALELTDQIAFFVDRNQSQSVLAARLCFEGFVGAKLVSESSRRTKRLLVKV